MAKAKSSLTLESKLGYKVDSSSYPEESSTRFYFDLRPIPSSTLKKSRVEFEEYEKEIYRKDKKIISREVLPDLNIVKVSRLRPS